MRSLEKSNNVFSMGKDSARSGINRWIDAIGGNIPEIHPYKPETPNVPPSSIPIGSTTDENNSDNETLINSQQALFEELRSSPQKNHVAPIFLVDGFMSFPIMDVWVGLITYFHSRSASNGVPCPPLIRLESGGVSSAHDTAVGLFYQIKGGKEDFGESHAATHKHDRFGLEYPGIYPEWSESKPINLLAHSFGGNVVLELQKLLELQFFIDPKTNKPYNTSGGWILSCGFISSPLRGSTATLILGSRPGEPGAVNFFSAGRAIYSLTQIWEWLEWHDRRSGWLGIHFRMSHFGLGRNRSLLDLAKSLLSTSVFDQGIDNSSFDISIEKYKEQPYETCDQTYYRSYSSFMTRSDSLGNEKPILHWLLPLTNLSRKIALFNMKRDGLGFLDSFIPKQSLWQKNDGICPLISQYHPQDCKPEVCHHFELPSPEKSNTRSNLPDTLIPGKWYVSTIPDCSHIDLVPGLYPLNSPKFLDTAMGFVHRASHILHPAGPNHFKINSNYVFSHNVPHYREAFMDDYYKFIHQVNSYPRSFKSL